MLDNHMAFVARKESSMSECIQTGDAALKLCKDCEHYRHMKDIGEHECTRDRGITNLVTGNVISVDCFAERYSSRVEACGREGKFFLKKER